MTLSVHSWVGTIKLLPVLDITCKSYGFSGDRIETKTNEYQQGRLDSVEVITTLIVMYENSVVVYC